MKHSYRYGTILLLGLLSMPAESQQRPPIRQIGAVTAKAAETFGGLGGIRALPNGSVLVNDIAGRRVLLFDPQLAKFTVVADSTSATGNAYGGRFGSLIQYRGDSSIFIDPASVSMLVIDGAGKIARVMAIPRADDAGMIGGAMGSAAFDPSGRLIYRAGGGLRMGMGGPGGGRQIQRLEPDRSGAVRTPNFQIPEPPDSAFILGVNLATRKVDTLGYIRTPKIKLDIQRDDNGNMRAQSMVNPLPVVDDWAVTPDGAVAFIRGRDYHVDWVNPDGTKTSSAKIPFNWQRMTDEDKVAFLDSVKAARERLGANAPVPMGGVGAGVGAGGGQTMVFSQITVSPGGPGPGARGGGAAGGPMQLTYVPASELPDYKPAFFAGSARADSDGNLWVRTIPTEAIAGGPVYDVINRKGELVERVQIPVNRTIIGFGGDKSVYMVNREGQISILEKASIR